MTSKSILTYGAKVNAVEQFYYSPSANVSYSTFPVSTVYCVLSRVDSWPNDEDPPIPTQDQKSIKNFLKNVFVAKKFNTADISPVIRRYDWAENTVYAYYRDDIDMFELDPNEFLINVFYIKNRYDQVFKCLWNNNEAPSVDEPYFEPGSYSSNQIFTGANDGYKWKYIFTVDTGQKVKFMDTSWIPVPVTANTPDPLASGAGYGNIDVINVVEGGSEYDPANAVITVSVTGDGTTRAIGSAVVNDGVITDIIVTNTGKNYTFANVSIISEFGSNASAIAPVSPIGGHGYDPISELGCNHVMVAAQFYGSESDFVPTDVTYYQVGILVNPTSLGTTPNPAENQIYRTTTDLVVASGFGAYSSGEIVYQGSSLENATFKATVLSFSVASNIVKLINTEGTLTLNAPVFGNSSQTTRTLLAFSNPDFVPLSGYLIFMDNRSGVQRSADGIEQFKIVIGY
jgi:hypothetical protein